MKKIIPMYLNAFFNRNLELRVKLFHVLAITGFVICVVMTWVSYVGDMYISMGINIGAGLVSLGLLIYSTRTGRYRPCYWITIVVIFFILFPSLFFSGGGYQGGMSFFFVFAVVFTVYMLDGMGMVLAAGAELIFYSFLCYLAYRFPEAVVPFPSEQAVVVDTIVGLTTVSISLGATMFVQVRMYQRQQKELELARKDAESASQAKSTFLANMSHEIRTPIHVILGMNEIIHRESRSRQVREYSERIGETSKMLLSLVDSVLDVSKIESGKMELSPDSYESAELVRTLNLIGKTQCSKKKLQFSSRIDPDLPPMLYGDLPHIRQIAANFLSNAVKYTEKGQITLSVSQEPAETGILLCISVSDTGIGVPGEILPNLFDAFSRADTAKNIEGTGLGLTIVRELTSLMGGTVSVDSHPGEGSTFTVKLPQQVLDSDCRRDASEAVSFLAPEVRLLVVDDNEGNRMVMKELLSATRMQVETAESGQECLDMVEETAYDGILMDYMMPGLDGAETMRRLTQKPGFHVPVIALTADATAETEHRLLEAGFSACLIKPVPWPRLRNVLLSLLPADRVTPVQETSENDHSRAEAEELLLPYGIILSDAMQYFDSFRDYCTTAELFLRYDGMEQGKVLRFLDDGDCERVRYPIHTLKGKARNLGMERLEELCIYAESLCTAGEVQELRCLLPYLSYIWKKGSRGLSQLLQTIRTQEKAPEPVRTDSQLGDLLAAFQRKPALDCIAGLLSQDSTEEGREALTRIRELVDAFRFDEAIREYESYQKRRDSL